MGGGERVVQTAGGGRGRGANLRDDVARPQTGPVSRRALAHDADAAAVIDRRHRLELLQCQVADVAGAIILVVKAFAGELDPFDGRTAAGERDEHARRAVRVERAERVMLPLRRRPFLQARWDGLRVAIRLAGGGGRLRRSFAPIFRRVQRGGGDFSGLPFALRFWKEPELQQLAGEHDGQRNGDKLGVATFHERLRMGPRSDQASSRPACAGIFRSISVPARAICPASADPPENCRGRRLRGFFGR